MSRPPLARQRILQAARIVVEHEGAGALTYEELSRVSGVTRGGITYHFPTKQQLLQALLDDDMAQWDASERALRPAESECACPEQGDLLAHIRSHTCQDEKRKRFVAGILSAAVHQPELLSRCREDVQRDVAQTQWNGRTLRDLLLRLAAEGLFWDEVFQMRTLPADVRERLIRLMEQLAQDWAQPYSQENQE